VQAACVAAEAALAASAPAAAAPLAQRLAAAGHAPAWRVAAALAAPALARRLGAAEDASAGGAAPAPACCNVAPGSDDVSSLSGYSSAVSQQYWHGGDHGLPQPPACAGLCAAERAELLAFAARHCGCEALGPVTDELLQALAEAEAEAEGEAEAEAAAAAAPFAPSAAGAPARRREQLRAAGAAATGGGAGAPALGAPDACLLLAALLSEADSAEAQRQLAAAANASAGVAAAAACARLQGLLATGAAAQALLATSPHAATALMAADAATAAEAVSMPDAVDECAAGASAALRRRLAALPLSRLVAAAGQLQGAGALSDAQRGAAARAARALRWLRAVAEGERPAVDWAALELGEAESIDGGAFSCCGIKPGLCFSGVMQASCTRACLSPPTSH
jgi:hypothetical protein